MKKGTKIFLISAVLAALLTAGLLYLAQRPSNGPNVFTLSIVPFYMIGVWFSGNVHQPSTLPVYLSIYLFFLAPVYATLFVCSKIGEGRDG